MKKKVLVADNLSKRGVEVLTQSGLFEVDIKTGLSEDELVSIAPEYTAIIVRSATKITARIIEVASQLKVVGRAGVGVDNIDLAAATQHGIVVMNAPDGNTISTAEHTMAMMLALARNIPAADARMKQGGWDRKKFMGNELRGKFLGVIGSGRIGREVIKRARAFEMTILVYDPYLTQEKADELDVELVSLDELFAQADYITVHTPLTEETKHLVNEKNIAKMKPTVRIINCARGGIVKVEDLCSALETKKVMGAAIDVYDQEPPAEDDPLRDQETLILTPHLGASTSEAQENVAVDVAKQIVAFVGQGTVLNAVNAPSLDKEALSLLQPYINLSEKLGLLSAQIMEGTLQSLEIIYEGRVSSYDTKLITIAGIKGLFKPYLKDEVNFVNAPVIAQQKGIKVTESKSSVVEDFADLVTIKVKTGKAEYLVAGTAFGLRNDPRVVRICEYRVDAIPEGYLLIIRNNDVPGIIGEIGTVLGKNKINIADMTLGRKEQGGQALTVLNVDQAVNDEVLDQLRDDPNIVSVRLVKL